jgi:cytochrome c biogenesis protein CcmG, thiol:disulfide interchange protein DsbE
MNMLKWGVFTFMNMDTHYKLLDIPAQATAEEIEAAYQRQRERYSPGRVAALGDDFRTIAEQRTADLERAYVILSDAARRREYDRSIGAASASAEARPPRRTGLTRRELLMTASGVLAGLVVIALVWVLAGRSAPPSLPPVAETNRPAPDFELQGLNGGTVRLSDYRGKIVLVNFWYTGCAPCREETPALQAAYRKLAEQGLQIVGVNVRPNERKGAEGDADIRSFIEQYGVTYPIALDTDAAIDRAFQVYVLPTTFFIDQNGKIRYMRFSTMTTEDVETLFNKLQQETSAQR